MSADDSGLITVDDGTTCAEFSGCCGSTSKGANVNRIAVSRNECLQQASLADVDGSVDSGVGPDTVIGPARSMRSTFCRNSADSNIHTCE